MYAFDVVLWCSSVVVRLFSTVEAKMMYNSVRHDRNIPLNVHCLKCCRPVQPAPSELLPKVKMSNMA